MTSVDLIDAMQNALKMYWRMKAGVALVRHSDMDEYSGIEINFSISPTLHSNPTLMSPEPAKVVFEEIYKYIDLGYLSKDIFLRTIAHLETFYSSKLNAHAIIPSGTFGTLQKACENSYGVTGNVIRYIDEMRERRNTLIHSHGIPNQKYLTAAMLVYAQSGGAIEDPNTVSILTLSDSYLVHCINSISTYSLLF